MSLDYLVSLLPYLACPVGMSLMMWLMMRGDKGQKVGPAMTPRNGEAVSPTPIEPGDRLARLRQQLGDLQAQQAAIAARIAGLSPGIQPVGTTGPEVTAATRARAEADTSIDPRRPGSLRVRR